MIRQGQKYRANEALEVIAVEFWDTPCTSGSRQTLLKGEVFTIDSSRVSDAIPLYCDAENPRLLYATFITESDLSTAQYRDCYLCVAIKDIVEKCEEFFELS